MSARIAFITCIAGTNMYELQQPVPQSIPADFICYTDAALEPGVWTLQDLVHHPTQAMVGVYNHTGNNTHGYNIARYYKLNFYKFPELKKYDVVVWCDAKICIDHTEAAALLLQQAAGSLLVPGKGSSLQEEMQQSACGKFVRRWYKGQFQPRQPFESQYQYYLEQGLEKDTPCYDTNVIAFNNKHPDLRKFLSTWYAEILTRTNNDRLSLPLVCKLLEVTPFLMDDRTIYTRV